MSETTTDSTTETAGETSADTSAQAEQIEGYDALGDAGKKALDRMKAERDAAISAAKDAKGDPVAAARIKAERAELAEVKTALAELKAKAEGKEAEFVAAQEAQKVKDEALSSANQRILKSEVKAAAKGVLADPQDAYKFLDLSTFEVDSDGNVDESVIAKALADLVATKPYLGAQGGQRFKGAADGGVRNDTTKPSQLTRADMAGMSPEQIDAAHNEGRFTDLLGSR